MPIEQDPGELYGQPEQDPGELYGRLTDQARRNLVPFDPTPEDKGVVRIMKGIAAGLLTSQAARQEYQNKTDEYFRLSQALEQQKENQKMLKERHAMAKEEATRAAELHTFELEKATAASGLLKRLTEQEQKEYLLGLKADSESVPAALQEYELERYGELVPSERGTPPYQKGYEKFIKMKAEQRHIAVPIIVQTDNGVFSVNKETKTATPITTTEPISPQPAPAVSPTAAPAVPGVAPAPQAVGTPPSTVAPAPPAAPVKRRLYGKTPPEMKTFRSALHDNLMSVGQVWDAWQTGMSGPVTGRARKIGTRYFSDEQFQIVMNRVGQLRTIVYGLSGKQINEGEQRWLDEEIKPNLNQPGENFEATLHEFEAWARRKISSLEHEYPSMQSTSVLNKLPVFSRYKKGGSSALSSKDYTIKKVED